MDTPEPWLRGSIPGVAPLIMPVLHSFLQVREDLRAYASGLQPCDIWCNVSGGTMGFHMKHIAGSVERITSYLFRVDLTEEQIQAARSEQTGDEDGDSLITIIENALSSSENKLRTIAPESLYDARTVGRKRLPSTVLGLLVHLAEHTQRHLGQIITLAKVIRQSA